MERTAISTRLFFRSGGPLSCGAERAERRLQRPARDSELLQGLCHVSSPAGFGSSAFGTVTLFGGYVKSSLALTRLLACFGLFPLQVSRELSGARFPCAIACALTCRATVPLGFVFRVRVTLLGSVGGLRVRTQVTGAGGDGGFRV